MHGPRKKKEMPRASRSVAKTRLENDSPYEVLAVAAEGRLLEEPRHEVVILHHVNILLLKGPLPSAELLGESGGSIHGPEGVLRVVRFLVVRHRELASSSLRANGNGMKRRRCLSTSTE